jgi:putative transcriptional regulator
MEKFEAQLLVAVPQLPDDNFYQAVILLIHHDDEGAFGVVLNRPSNFPLKEVWYAITESDCDVEAPIYMGGPVEGPLLAVHQRKSIAENEIVPGVFISSQKDNLEILLKEDVVNCKIFSGYSGWGPGQLEAELATGSWFRTPVTPDDVFSETDHLWEEVAGRIGNQVLFQGVGNKIEKFDPSLN